MTEIQKENNIISKNKKFSLSKSDLEMMIAGISILAIAVPWFIIGAYVPLYQQALQGNSTIIINLDGINNN